MRSILIFLITLIVSAAAGLLLTYPMAGAMACPSCFGFAAAGDNIYVQDTMPDAERRAARATLQAARDRVRRFYGALLREPQVFLCADEACYQRYAGEGSRGTAFLDRALILAPGAVTVPIAAHELSHIEFHARIGLIATARDRVPRWFDEGLAINVSDDPRYLLPGSGAARCRLRSNEPLPVDRRDWFAAADGALYAASACRVAEWLAARGGPSAALKLADAIAAGSEFDDALR
jgi:hypothetical protein